MLSLSLNKCIRVLKPSTGFLQAKTGGKKQFVIPYLSVSELGKNISKLESKNIFWSG